MKKKLIIIVFLLSLILLTTKVEARDIKAIEPKITLESCPIFGDPDADGTRPAVNSKGEVRKDKKGKVVVFYLKPTWNVSTKFRFLNIRIV